jgi:hypothetical protein
VCDPTGISETALVEIAIGATVATTAVTAIAAHQQAMKQQGAINAQADARATQVASAAGQQQSVAAMEARQARSQSVVAAGESGINLGSNSFLASLQTTTMNQANNEGLIMENEKNQQAGDTATVQSELNTQATSPTFLGGGLNAALSGAGAYMSTTNAYKAGANSKSTPGTTTS